MRCRLAGLPRFGGDGMARAHERQSWRDRTRAGAAPVAGWHRGMREMDLIMGRFAEMRLQGCENEHAEFEERLRSAGQRLDWLIGGVTGMPQERLTPVMAVFRCACAISAARGSLREHEACRSHQLLLSMPLRTVIAGAEGLDALISPARSPRRRRAEADPAWWRATITARMAFSPMRSLLRARHRGAGVPGLGLPAL